MFKSDVFDRSVPESREISASLYNFIIGAVLLWGFILTAIVQGYFHNASFGWIGFIGYIACVFVGTMLARSENPGISLLGYHCVVVPTGVFLGPFVNALSPQVLQNTLFLTGGVTCGMMGLGTIFPRAFAKIGGALFISLIALIVVSLLESFVFKRSFTIVDYIAAGIFSLYIAYDYARAQLIPKTFDNAVDVCIALYLDIINLFIRLASILSRRD
jgi:FtsH-binding integral membrane protein